MSDDSGRAVPLRGYLVIHVGGYKMRQQGLFHVYSEGNALYSVPDRLVPAPVASADTKDWAEHGWAVGDNPRERFCKWGGAKPLRRFHDFDEAVSYIHRLRQKRKRPQEVYTLVYVTRGALGHEMSRPVSSLDDIAEFELEITSEEVAQEMARRGMRAQYEQDYPEYERLRTAYGHRRGTSLSRFLGTLRREGRAKAKASVPTSTFYNHLRDLRALGLGDDAEGQ